jgi:hypothetical protein
MISQIGIKGLLLLAQMLPCLATQERAFGPMALRVPGLLGSHAPSRSPGG